jgi:cysteine-rich repeat protein
MLAGLASAAVNPGYYWDTKTDGLNGALELGTWTETFNGGNPGQSGNIFSAKGETDQWNVTGLTLQDGAKLISNEGGVQRYKTAYSGGTLTIQADNAWGDEIIVTNVHGTIFADKSPEGLHSMIVFEGKVDSTTQPYNVMMFGEFKGMPEMIIENEEEIGHTGPIDKGLLHIAATDVDFSVLEFLDETISSRATQESVDAISTQIDDLDYIAQEETSQGILELLLNEEFGLEEIKKEVKNIEDRLPGDNEALASQLTLNQLYEVTVPDTTGEENTRIGIWLGVNSIWDLLSGDITTNLNNVKSMLENEEYGLDALSTQISDISLDNLATKEDVSGLATQQSVDDLNNVVAQQQTSQEILDLLNDGSIGLGEIKTEVSTIETTVLENLDIAVSTRASQDSVDALSTQISDISLDNLATKDDVSGLATQQSVDDLNNVVAQQQTSQEILDLLNDGSIGLGEIKTEIRNIEDKLPEDTIASQSKLVEVFDLLKNAALDNLPNLDALITTRANQSTVDQILDILEDAELGNLINLDWYVSTRASQTSVDDLQTDVTKIGEDVKDIKGEITHPTYGLEEIKEDITALKDEVFNEEHGLFEIKEEIRAIETQLDSVEYKLDQLLAILGGVSLCGNGIVDPGEECDDANNIDGDGCSATCKFEFCGDNIINNDWEECETDSDCETNQVCNDCLCEDIPEKCGNGELDPGEECEATGIYEGQYGPGSEFMCNADKTLSECNPATCKYEDTEQCSSNCGASQTCNGVAPETELESCSFGSKFLGDYCDANCQAKDTICESGFAGCTGAPECDGFAPGTGGCTSQCQLPTPVPCDTDGATKRCGESGCYGLSVCSNGYWTACSSQGLSCGVCKQCSAQGQCTQFDLSCVCEQNGKWNEETGTTGNQFRCVENRTYEQCNEDGIYEPVNACKHLCSASAECDLLQPGTNDCSANCIFTG